jgi:hypothetical protein
LRFSSLSSSALPHSGLPHCSAHLEASQS